MEASDKSPLETEQIDDESETPTRAGEVTETKDTVDESGDAEVGKRSDNTPDTESVQTADQTAGPSEDSELHLDFDSPADKLDVSARNRLYERGQELRQKARYMASLKCFLRCLSGLDGTNGFPYLPQCLRHVADIYYTQEEYEKAVQFVQAEKLYYETALVDTEDIQNRIEAKRQKETNEKSESRNDADPVDPELTNPDVIRAEEYEGLAKMCLERKQPQLALEYQAKATKLKQQALGEDHPLTKRSLDFFTVVYGEVGKLQYSESIQKLTVPLPKSDTQSGSDDTLTPPAETSGLRQRKNIPPRGDGVVEASSDKDNTEETSTDQQQVSQERRAQEEWISQMLLIVMFCLCVIVLLGATSYLYCKIDTKSSTCATWRSDVYYYYMRFKYWYYSTVVSDGKTYG